MSKVVYGPVLAIFKYCPNNSKIKCVERKLGILEILESKNRNSRKHYAVFYFSSVTDNPFTDSKNFITNSYAKTSICTLKKIEKEYTFYRDKGDEFIFEEIDSGIIKDLRTLN